MTKEELAARLNGREYGSEISKPEATEAKGSGLVVVFGASDDLMEFRGAISEEVSCFDGGTALVTEKGLLINECDEGDDCPNWRHSLEWIKSWSITANWCAEGDSGPSWRYTTSIPHSTFLIIEDDDVYCHGIVFAMADLAGGAA